MKYLKYYLLALFIILLDQGTKLSVHTYMALGDEGEITVLGDWFKLHYTLNEGMAFGIKFGSAYGKLMLTLFRWLAMSAIAVFIFVLVKRGYPSGLPFCTSLILAGAVGNVIDSTFYGVALDNAPPVQGQAPPFYPWFHGQVVDMFYIDIWQGVLPGWIPVIGGSYYAFWPIFNVADAAIFTGVTLIFLMQRHFFRHDADNEETNAAAMAVPVENEHDGEQSNR